MDLARVDHFIDEISAEKCSMVTPYRPMKRDRNYHRGFRAYLNHCLAWEATGSTAFVCQIHARKPGVPNARFSWNPSKVSALDIAVFVFGDYLSLAPAVLRNAWVSGLHLAIDVPGVHVDEVAASYARLRVNRNMFGADGSTRYLGAASGRTSVCIYDKRSEIVASNKRLGTYPSQLSEAVPEHPLSRFEVRLQGVGYLRDLHNISNPFGKLRVHMVSDDLTQLERLVVRLCRYEGLNPTLKCAGFSPSQRRTLMRKMARTGTPIWWRPRELWAEQFPAEVKDLTTPFCSEG